MTKLKVLFLSGVTALSPVTKMKAQVNHARQEIQKIVVTEFKKADINPTDMYISQNELNKYVGNNLTKIKDFDGNGDAKLNIDEFKNFILGVRSQNQTVVNRGSTSKTTAKVNVSKKFKTKKELLAESIDIKRKLKYYLSDDGMKKTTKSGQFGNVKIVREFQRDKILNTVLRINADNLTYVLDGSSLYNFYQSIVHTTEHGNPCRSNFGKQLCAHFGNVLDDYATKFKMHSKDLDRSINYVKNGGFLSLDRACKAMHIEMKDALTLF